MHFCFSTLVVDCLVSRISPMVPHIKKIFSPTKGRKEVGPFWYKGIDKDHRKVSRSSCLIKDKRHFE